jgi:hypothetical protein
VIPVRSRKRRPAPPGQLAGLLGRHPKECAVFALRYIANAALNLRKQLDRLSLFEQAANQILRQLRGYLSIEHVPLVEHGPLAYPIGRSAHRHQGISGKGCHADQDGENPGMASNRCLPAESI